MEISCASLLWYCKHSFPIPPVDVKIRGVKVPYSKPYVQNLPRVEALLLILLIAVYMLELQVPIRISIRVKDSHVEEC